MVNMEKEIVIVGCSEFSRMMASYLKQDGYIVAAYCQDRKYMDRDCFIDWEGIEVPVAAFEDIETVYPPDQYDMLITIGYNSMNEIRKNKYHEAKAKGYSICSYIHKSAVNSAEQIGEGNILLENVSLGKGVILGDCNILQMNTVIAHHTKIGSFNFFAPGAVLAGDIEVADNCFFGINCAVKNGIHVAEYTLCGAGSVVAFSTESYNVVVPGRSVILDKDSRNMRLLT